MAIATPTATEEAVPPSRSARISPARLVMPGFLAAWVLFVIVPLGVIVVFSFFQVQFYQIVYEPTLATWQQLIDTGRWQVALRTLRVALTITALELLIAFPFALWLAKGCRSKTFKAAILTLLTIPFLLDVASRIIVWRSILGTNGMINTFLMWTGITAEPIDWLLYSEFAVHLGLLGSSFPTMVIPVFVILLLIDDDYIKASSDLGASPVQTLFYVIVPLALPGILAGVIFTFVPLMAAYVEPQLLGGGFVDLLGNSVDSALSQLRYPMAAALSTVVVIMLSLCLLVFVLFTRNRLDLSTIFSAMKR